VGSEGEGRVESRRGKGGVGDKKEGEGRHILVKRGRELETVCARARRAGHCIRVCAPRARRCAARTQSGALREGEGEGDSHGRQGDWATEELRA
jgi:hypothetical protein